MGSKGSSKDRAEATVVLRDLRVEDEAEAMSAEEELVDDGFEFLPQRSDGEEWASFVARVRSQRDGLGLPEGFVPCTFLVAEVDGRIIGRTSIRHGLNGFLRRVGGHIGYGVRPAYRRRGYATQILRQSLAICSGLGIDQALVTCDDDNEGSIRVIERCCGVLQNRVHEVSTRSTGSSGSAVSSEGPGLKRRYWVPTDRSA